MRSVLTSLAAMLLLVGRPAPAGESYETAPVRPDGGDFVPPPFPPLERRDDEVACLGRRYRLTGLVPTPQVGNSPLLTDAGFQLNGQPLTPPPAVWTLSSPAVLAAERSWEASGIKLSARQVVEYDGFVSVDLTLAPRARKATVSDLSLRIVYRPEASVLYDIPAFSTTSAGFWPADRAFERIAGVWGGNDQMGFATYVATYRDWRGDGPYVVLRRDGDGPGTILFRVISRPMELDRPVTYRFGFIATPVRPPEPRHWQLYALSGNAGKRQKLADRLLFWGGMSDHYATFVTNDPAKDDDRTESVAKLHAWGQRALAYTTYAHVEEGAVEVPNEWCLIDQAGNRVARSIGGGMADLNRVFLCPGNPAWVDWKIADLEHAVERYDLDGFYVDTSYVIMPCTNSAHGHGWVDEAGARWSDYPVWSMREVWRRAYELLCDARGEACIYAHHKSGCPAALAAFTSAFCDGEQYTGRSIKTLTLDAFRAQNAGRNIGPLAHFLDEYYRSANFGLRERGEHHNPTESTMLALLHDTFATGLPGLHPLRELLQLRDDLGIAEADWTPYYIPDNPWRCEGADGIVCSSYQTARGDTLVVVGNPTYQPAQVRVSGPDDATAGRQAVLIDVFSRVGRAAPLTAGYRWEPAPAAIEVPARSLRLVAWIKEPDGLPAFAAQRGYATATAGKRRVLVPAGALLVSDFDDPDWVLLNDDGELTITDREPVDTLRALRVEPRPQHYAAALFRSYAEPQDWSAYGGITLWLRPDNPFPVRALDVRLRNAGKYTQPFELVSHRPDAVLPAGEWTELRYLSGDAPRNHVQALRIYYHRGELCSGPFDLDEVILHPGADPDGAAADRPRGGEEDKPIPD